MYMHTYKDTYTYNKNVSIYIYIYTQKKYVLLAEKTRRNTKCVKRRRRMGNKTLSKGEKKKKGEESKKIYILIQDIHLSLYKKYKQIV